MTTKQVFEEIISKRAWYKDLGYTEAKGSSLANRFRNNKLSIDKMEEVITKAGYQVVQEKRWGK